MGSHTLQQLKRLSFDELKALFETTMRRVQTFHPIESEGDKTVPELTTRSSKRDAEVELDHEGSKKQKTNEASGSVQEQPEEEETELPQEDLQQMMMVVPVEEVYVEALQIFAEMLKKFDRDDLVKLWDLVKERFSTTEPTDDKEKELWVELKRLFEPDSDDTLWKLQRYMHDPLVWRLYDTCGVHHVSSVRGHDIFMLVEKDYPLSKGVQMLMLGNKLWFNSEKLVDLDDNHKFRGGLLGFKPITLSTAKGKNSEEFMNVLLKARVIGSTDPNWFPLTRVKWLPFMANLFAVSGIVIAESGVGATTQSAAHMSSSSIRS
ncbi:hypothetical protein Tco_0228569 [Tanacetum coccineum]